MYPKDEVFDSNGRDLNATANGSFYTLYTRLGLDVKGPKLGRAMTSAKVEADFRGSGTSYSTIRLRHAYLNLVGDVRLFCSDKPGIRSSVTYHLRY